MTDFAVLNCCTLIGLAMFVWSHFM